MGLPGAELWPSRPRAGGRRRFGGGAGAAASRRCAVRQRRRLWQPGGCRRTGLSLPRAAGPAGRSGAGEGADGVLVAGPTCDSADAMRGPFMLPADVAEGDWIEVGQLGAYGGCFRTAFNGFDRARMVEVQDPPLERRWSPSGWRRERSKRHASVSTLTGTVAPCHCEVRSAPLSLRGAKRPPVIARCEAPPLSLRGAKRRSNPLPDERSSARQAGDCFGASHLAMTGGRRFRPQ